MSYVCWYGVPVQLHTDLWTEGRNFESKLIEEMCKILEMNKTRTSPYHPQSDGMVERFNRTLETMLAKYMSKNHEDWDGHLQLVMLAYRSSVHETTKQTPFFMSFGREVRLPVEVMFGGSEIRKTRDEYVDDVLMGVRWIHQPCTGKTISRKFYQPWSGRYRVIKRMLLKTINNYKLLDTEVHKLVSGEIL